MGYKYGWTHNYCDEKITRGWKYKREENDLNDT